MDLDVGLDPGELGVAVCDLGLESVEVRRNGGQLCGEVADPRDAYCQFRFDLGPPGDGGVDQSGGDFGLPLRRLSLLLGLVDGLGLSSRVSDRDADGDGREGRGGSRSAAHACEPEERNEWAGAREVLIRPMG